MLSIREYQRTPPRINKPPNICSQPGSSPKRKPAITAATTGSQSLDAETKEGEKYFKHQLKILWPNMVEHTASSKPTITALQPYANRL